ncbi:hypothetical protein ACFVIM_19490, partial [Streptomyces sp. NPDC057638]|uniref:hypothetical protein n=1 Tax=Streptomyces sp. NPDC057638 TaxID=3346190 RepID=UPI003698C954
LLPRPDPATASPGVPEPGTKMPTEAKVAAEAEATPRPRSRARTVSPAALPPPPPPVSGTPDDAPRPPAPAEHCAALPLASFGDPGSAVGRAEVPASDSVCYTLAADRPGPHRILVTGKAARAEVYDGDARLDCDDPRWGAGWCVLPRTGDFTLRTFNNGASQREISVAVYDLGATASCAATTGTAWDTPALTGSLPGPLALFCQPFDAEPGDRIIRTLTPERKGRADAWITDATGARICATSENLRDGCVLPGPGPYRILGGIKESAGGFPAEYSLEVRRLNDPVGCLPVPLNTYNSAPTAGDPAHGCRTFSSPAAHRYDFYQVVSGVRGDVMVHDRSGRLVCDDGESCALPAAGDYTLRTAHDTLVLDPVSTVGCEPADLGVHRGTITAPGEIDCLTLPLPEGARLAALRSHGGAALPPEISVVDGEGIARCQSAALRAGVCALAGRGPFRLLAGLAAGDGPTGPYDIAFYRTDGHPIGCSPIPAGDFTALSPGLKVATGGGVFAHCLSVPADDHSGMEQLQLQQISGTAAASLSVLNAKGEQICSTLAPTWATCAMEPGTGYTVLLDGRDEVAEYAVTRRDITATAKGCVVNPAAAVGGPSTAGATAAAGVPVCRQVTTENTTDTLHLDVRDLEGATRLTVFDERGAAVDCTGGARACAVTGSTSYQVLVTVPEFLRTAGPYRFDAVRVATAAGPAPECVRAPNVSYGYGPVLGTLTEESSISCAVLPTAQRDLFKVDVTDTAGGTEAAVPALYDAGGRNVCRHHSSGYQCRVDTAGPGGDGSSLLVLGLPERASQTAYRAELICAFRVCGPDRPTVTTVAPMTGPSGGTVTVTLSGSALHEKDTLVLQRVGSGSGSGTKGVRRVESTTVSVAPDRRTLTAVFDLSRAPKGSWRLTARPQGGGEYPMGTFTVTPAVLVNLHAPTVTGPVRVGERVTATTGAWAPRPSSYGYQWFADGQAITGARDAEFRISGAQFGRELSVRVTAHRPGSDSVAARSLPVPVHQGLAPRATNAPVIVGVPRVGARLTAIPGTWTVRVSSYAYQWQAGGEPIPGATDTTFRVPAALVNAELSVAVTARAVGHADGVAFSRPVTVEAGTATLTALGTGVLPGAARTAAAPAAPAAGAPGARAASPAGSGPAYRAPLSPGGGPLAALAGPRRGGERRNGEAEL